ncbi:hypothetical protein HNY73_011347 [Argiope bruennichi]|uniref:BESS domain-containing protein n=1 Tax=Argiope bruennichi TaxID=94029 RepID=A0A8T0F6J1_ARGBR|nr:hypothetical protein HNY73_011347 [Argiope bruennichi]
MNILSRKMNEILGFKLEKIQTLVSGLNSTRQNLKGKLNTLISNKNGSFMENIEFLVTEIITGLIPNATLDISEMKIPKFLELSDPQETEFGWIASGRLEEAKTNDVLGSCFLLNGNSVGDTLKPFFSLESLGIRDDPCIHEDQALKIFNDTVQYNNGRYIVELPFRKHIKELSDNLIVAKERFQNLWRSSEKESRVITSTRIVFNATSHQANELSLNDCLWPGPNLYPNLLDVLINSKFNKIAISQDIRQAFLQICVTDKYKDAVRFLWTFNNPRTEKKPVLEVYRLSRVIFGINASPFLLAATVKHHIKKYREKNPTTVKHLDSFMYVDDWITGQDTREEDLISCQAKNVMKEAGMEMRKWISNDSTLMSQWVAESFDIYPVDTSVFLGRGSNKTKVLGMAWQTGDDCLTLDTTGSHEWISFAECCAVQPLKIRSKLSVGYSRVFPSGHFVKERFKKSLAKAYLQEATSFTNPTLAAGLYSVPPASRTMTSESSAEIDSSVRTPPLPLKQMLHSTNLKQSSSHVKKKKNKALKRMNQALSKLKSLTEEATLEYRKKEPEDEFTHFGRNVASQLRALPITEALSVQREILHLIRESRLKIIKPSKNVDPSASRVTSRHSSSESRSDLLFEAIMSVGGLEDTLSE